MEKVVCNIKKIFWSNEKRILIFLFILICFFRLWLLYGSNWRVNIDTYYDSHLQINQAVSIVSGGWLGTYTKFTLCKNPIYPIFLALLAILHIPYAYGLGFLMIGTSILFIKAISPIVNNKWAKLLIFSFLLYNPVNGSSYHYRNALLIWLVLAVVSCIIAIFLRRRESIKKVLPYSIIGMVFMGAFWLLREDSIWLLPFAIVAYVLGVSFLIIEKTKTKKIILYAIISFLPIFGIFIFNTTISLINYKCYGIYATNDRMQTNSAKVLGLLIKIDDGSDLNKDMWISSKTIKLAKKASPTFNSLNLDAFDKWSKLGDHSIWAIRDVMTDSGYYIDAKETNEVYGKIASELKLAFKKGKLKPKKGIQLSNTSGIFSVDEINNSLLKGIDVVKNHIPFNNVKNEIENVANSTNDSDIHLYEEVLGINLIRDNKYIENSNPTFAVQNNNHLRSLYHNLFFCNVILAIYQHINVILFVFGTIGLAYGIYNTIKRKSEKYDFDIIIIMFGLLLLTYLNAVLIVLFSTSFHPLLVNDIIYNYTDAEYLLIILYEIFGLVYFEKMTVCLYQKLKKASIRYNKKNSNNNFHNFLKIVMSFDLKKIFQNKTDNSYLQFFRYLFVGGFAAVVNIGMLYVFTDICNIYYLLSNILSFILGLTINYILSKKFVFQEVTSFSPKKEFIIYAIIGIIGLGIDTILMWCFTDILSIYHMISKIISTMIVFIWNFGARKILYKVIK